MEQVELRRLPPQMTRNHLISQQNTQTHKNTLTQRIFAELGDKDGF